MFFILKSYHRMDKLGCVNANSPTLSSSKKFICGCCGCSGCRGLFLLFTDHKRKKKKGKKKVKRKEKRKHL